MVTLKDIAREANVTVSTVSRALKGDSEIALATRNRIMEIAFRLGYRHRREGQGRMHIMGVIIPDMNSGFFTDILVALDQQLSETEYAPLYVPYYFDDDSCKKAFEFCKRRNVEGIFAVSMTSQMAFYVRQFTEVNAIPVVAILPQAGDFYNFLDEVRVDLTGAIQEAIALFVKNGHKKIGLMTDVMNYKIRGLEYETAFRNNGLMEGDYSVFLEEARFEEGGYRCMMKALKSSKCPTAFIIGYDQFAIGACRAVREMGLRIPEDIAICGIDNLGMDAYINPALASIATPTKEMVRVAINYMKKALQGDEERPVYRTALNGKLYVRETMTGGKKNE